MSRHDKLERWGELLERDPVRPLRTLSETEYLLGEERLALRHDNSPISIAFADPVLRGEGLHDDSYGECRRYFELSDYQLHNILYWRHIGESVSAGTAAKRIRDIIRPPAGTSRVGQFVRRILEMKIGS